MSNQIVLHVPPSDRALSKLREKLASAQKFATRYERSINASRESLQAFPCGPGSGNARSRKRQSAEIDRDLKTLQKLEYWREQVARYTQLIAGLEAGTRHANGQRKKVAQPKTQPNRARPVQLFICDMVGGFVYCDRNREFNGDFKRLAFKPRNGALRWHAKQIPANVRAQIEKHAAQNV